MGAGEADGLFNAFSHASGLNKHPVSTEYIKASLWWKVERQI
jgi:hypothetical protein